MKARGIMSTPAVSVYPGQSLDVAVQRMWDRDCGFLMVVTNEGKLVGVITDRDICLAAHARGRPLHEIQISEAMVETVRSCRPDDTVDFVESIMRTHRVRRVPVIGPEREPVGVVSVNDIVRRASESQRRTLFRDATRTMAAICEPRQPSHRFAPHTAARPGEDRPRP